MPESSMAETSEIGSASKLELATDIVTAYLSNNQIPAGELPDLIRNVHAALAGVEGAAAAAVAAAAPVKPAVSVKSSVRPDAITCLHCGKGFKTLKRHLSAEHGQSLDEYRGTFGLTKDYPVTAPNYSAARAKTAKKIGLGKKKKK